MSVRFISKSLLSLNKGISVIVNRALSSTSYHWKILSIGADKDTAAKAQESLRSQGYKDARVIAINNSKESDQELIKALKEKQWDGVSIGGCINGSNINASISDENVPKDPEEILVWFNRVLNIVHEMRPKSKIILVKLPQDIHAKIQQVMQGKEE